MKSVEVYRILREAIGPWCKSEGFKRGSGGMLSYFRQEATGIITFWFQCDKWGWDVYGGSQFTLEFQRGSNPAPGAASLSSRLRFGELMSAGELEQATFLQNIVLRRIDGPPANHPIHFLPPADQAVLKEQLVPMKKPWSPGTDVWLRYLEPADVERWARFIGPMMPTFLTRFTNMKPSV